MTEQLKASIVRFIDTGGRVVGAGFLAGERTVVTCAHVVAQALGIPADRDEIPSESVKLDFPLVAPGAVVYGTVARWLPIRNGSADAGRKIEDIAVLELQSAPPEGSAPSALLRASDVWGHTFRAFGFPAAHDNGVWASGLLRDMQTSGWVQIEDVRQTGYFVAPGFSGTPVWDEQVNGIIGMVVVADRRAEIRAAFIIPAADLLSASPAVRELTGSPAGSGGRPAIHVAPHAAREKPFWTETDPHYRGLHEADRNSAEYRPDVLMVLVSGGKAIPAWDDLPAEVLPAARIDIDVLSVDCAPDSATPKKIAAAAAELRDILSAFAAYRHLLFVVQDCDLIVRQLFIDDAASAPESAATRALAESRLTCRCRSIVSVSTKRSAGQTAKSIATAFDEHLASYAREGLPTPTLVSISATAGKGSATSLPRPLVMCLAERLAPFRAYFAAAYARGLIVRTCAMDPQVRKLFGNPESESSSGQASGESQIGLLHRLGTARTSSAQWLYVINGTAGVGKSVLLRMVARQLATAWLRGAPDAGLPLSIPLSQFKLDIADPSPQNIWNALVSQWTAWINEQLIATASEAALLRPDLLRMEESWLRNQLRRNPTTLILDSVDEFLLNHPQLSLADFASFLRFLKGEFGENTEFMTIACIRSSARGVTLLTDSDSQVLTLRRMKSAEATAIFPSAMRQIGQASDEAVQELLLTPLVLSTLEKSNLQLKPEAYLNRTTLIEAALTAIIATLKNAWSGTPHTTTSWMNALSLVAWFRYRGLRAEIDDRDVGIFAEAVVAAWCVDETDGATAEVIDSFRILLDPKARATLLSHSIFFSIRESSYRLKHQEWGDYLVAHYAVLCIRHGRFEDLAARAMNHDIYMMAGQQLQERDTDARTIRALVDRAASGGKFLALANFAQMLGDSFAPLTGDVLEQEILARLHLFPKLVRFGTLSALGSRLLLNDKRDCWRQHLRAVLLRAFAREAGDEMEDALLRSVSWCYLRALTDTQTPWPPLWREERDSLDCLSLISNRSGDQYEASEMQRSIQAAFMRIQNYVLEIPGRVISTAHYLYPLALAYHEGVPLERTVVVELPSLLSDPRIDAIYRDFPVREVGAIWNRCRELCGETVMDTDFVEEAS